MTAKLTWREQIAHTIVATPFEGYALRLRQLKASCERLWKPKYTALLDEESAIDTMMAQTIKNGMNCIDVGCHLGLMISQMQRASPTGKHMAIEPIPYKAALLRTKFPHVSVLEYALSDREGEAEFFIQPTRSGFSGLKLHDDGVKNVLVEKITVQCRPLDMIVPTNHPVDFLKIDVEGAELLVLRGAEKTIARTHPVILFECTLTGLETFHHSASDIYDLLVTQHGYKIFAVADWLSKKEAMTFAAFQEAMRPPERCFNFLAVSGEVA